MATYDFQGHNPNYNITDMDEAPRGSYEYGDNKHTEQRSHRLKKIQFVRILFDKPNKVIAELDPDEVSDGATLSWEWLIEEARKYSDFAGFRFTDTLYLSPRQKQDLAIRSQATLTAAIKDLPSGAVAVFTTRLMKKDDRMTRLLYEYSD